MAALEALFEITVYSAVIFAVIMIAKVCFKNRLSPFLQYAIWGIFILRLMIPITMESPIHLITLPAEKTVSTQEAMQYTQNGAFDFMTPAFGAYAKEQNALNSGKTDISAESTKQGGDSVASKQAIPLTLPQILLIIWLCGSAVCLCYFMVLAFLLKRKACQGAGGSASASFNAYLSR